MPIATLADRLEGKPIEEKQAKMLSREAADFISQAHDMEAQGEYQRAVDLCDAACRNLSVVYGVPQRFEERRLVCGPLDATIFTKHVFAAKLRESEGRADEALKEVEAARKVYEIIIENPDLFLPSFDSYLEDLEELEKRIKK